MFYVFSGIRSGNKMVHATDICGHMDTKVYTQYRSVYMIFQKRLISSDRMQITGCLGEWLGRTDWEGLQENFWGW